MKTYFFLMSKKKKNLTDYGRLSKWFLLQLSKFIKYGVLQKCPSFFEFTVVQVGDCLKETDIVVCELFHRLWQHYDAEDFRSNMQENFSCYVNFRSIIFEGGQAPKSANVTKFSFFICVFLEALWIRSFFSWMIMTDVIHSQKAI